MKSTWLNYVQINGSKAVDGTNCQVKMYGAGTIIMPYGSSFKPLTCYTGADFTGTSYNGYTTGSNGGYMKTLTTALGLNNIKSFKLKRGYMVTFATGTAGYGYSRCFIADTEDLEINLPAVLAGKVSSYRLFMWYDAQKKGLASDVVSTPNSALNTSWCYTWNVTGSSMLPDQEWVPHKIQKDWPGVADCGNTEYACHMKTDNEPANSSDDNPATVDQVLGYWENAMRTGMRLCAPSSHDGGYTWQEQFMNEIDARGWRCDILDMHCYWVEGSFSNLINYYNKFKRPIWVSEWIWGASWNSNGAFASGVTDATILSTTQSIWNKMNGYPYVERYAYWNSESKAKIYDGGLTSLGTAYANMDSGIGYNKSYEFVPVVVIKKPYSLNVEDGGNGTALITWKDSNGDMMDEIQVQYKPAGSSTWQTLATVTRKDKTSTSDQSYTYAATVSDWENCSFRIVDKYDGTDYPSVEYRKLDATTTTDQLTFIPANTSDFYFQFYSKEATTDLVWGLVNGTNSAEVYYKTPDTPGNDLTQLWTLEANDYGGYTMRNLSSEEYVMCSPYSWNFVSNNSDYKSAALKATYLPIYYSSGDYWVVQNVGHNTYVGLWDKDKSFAVGERLAGNRTNATSGNDSGDKIGIRAIPRSAISGGSGSGVTGKYYLYNPSAGLFLTAANNWGTQASLAETGVDLNIIASGAYSLLDTNITNGGESHYMGSNLYMDGGSTNWTITESGTHTDGKTTYTFTTDGTNYLAAPASGSVATTVTSATDAHAQWVLYSCADLVNQMLGATESNPVNATFLLPGYGFSRNDNRNLNWSDSPKIGGDNANMNGEKYNTIFDVYQEIVGVPNGVYELTMQGFYRNGGYADAATARTNGTEALNAILYMNDTEVALPSIFEGAGKSGTTGVNTAHGYIPNGQGDASAYFNANNYGNYQVGPISVTVTDGTLRIGVKKSTEVTNDWTVFDNFKLLYYGEPSQTTLGTPTWSIDDGSYIQSYNGLSVSFPRAESTASGATFSLIGSNPIATLSDGTNTYNGSLSLSGKTVSMNFNGFSIAPGKDYTVTLPANTVGFEGRVTNDLMTLTFHTPLLYDNTYYMLNDEEYKYISRGQTWNTQAIVDDYGLAIRFETDTQGNTHLRCFDSELYIFNPGDDYLYADGTSAVDLTPQIADGGYRFKVKSNSLFLGVDGTALVANRSASDATTIWTLEPLANHTANYQRNADTQSAQSANDAGISNISTTSALEVALADDFVVKNIEVTGAKEEKFQVYATNAQNSAPLDYFSETVTGLTPGLYRLSADAFQRAAGFERVSAAEGARGLIFLFANEAKTQLKSVMDYGATSAYASDFAYDGLHYPNNEASAYTALETGNYNNVVYVYVPADQGSTTGSLTFGVRIETRLGVNAATWAAYENFKLEYLAPIIVLDETSGNPPQAANDATVRFNRSIVAKSAVQSNNAWNTICFPFAMDNALIKQTFGDNTIVKELDHVIVTNGNASFKFKDATSIEANKPYLLQTDQAGTQYTFTGIDITPTEQITQTVDGVDFVGVYTYPTAMTNPGGGDDYYLLNDVFKRSSGKTKMKGYRAYFHVPAEAGIKTLGFDFDGNTTAISVIDADTDIALPADIYSVGGQLIRRQTTDISDLPAGIYIVNGHKLIKR